MEEIITFCRNCFQCDLVKPTPNTIFSGGKLVTKDVKNQTVLYSLIFPLWITHFMPRLIPQILIIKFIINTLIVNLYLKKHKKFNRLKIYCFRAFGSEKTTQPEINRGVVFGYSLKAAVFGYFANFLGGVVMVGFLEMAPFDKYMDTYLVWSNFVSGFVHILIVLLVGILIYLYHRKMARSLNLDSAEAHGLGLIMAILTAPWFFFIPTAWLC